MSLPGSDKALSDFPEDIPCPRMDTTSAPKSERPRRTRPRYYPIIAGTPNPQKTAIAGPSIGDSPVIERTDVRKGLTVGGKIVELSRNYLGPGLVGVERSQKRVWLKSDCNSGRLRGSTSGRRQLRRGADRHVFSNSAPMPRNASRPWTSWGL
ncbi:MAG: hypothetical protein Ct9H300mP25_09180 [Acidobacteriota bacterium]|nr:MAG: hypothetical protein Ct9H300mP25_09180 [Acidobacteriota bacterium]